MKVRDVPFEDAELSSHQRINIKSLKVGILKHLRKARKTIQNIESYIEDAECDQISDDPSSMTLISQPSRNTMTPRITTNYTSTHTTEMRLFWAISST